ncbi:hypothetical protein FHS43_006075 [Streptosporangium becharense]|uniref:Uncharacterized protein n=1 Tax=Streptosporangium becharense TaxID=1816182 RepID=A0A7W9IIC7_9ACTN|nr:hypothetical protein [Streptosporangium becharense]MBB2914763.1 hypothetical protein [Streptosporangium becharense]MBB5820836.1 hypothetical protein [Streptosporangium becharense]
MRKIPSLLAALTGTALLTAALATPASASSASATPASTSSASGTYQVTFRGMTLTFPLKWVSYQEADRIKVVTGSCADRAGDYFTPGCRAFWIFGPERIKRGHEGFNRYTPSRPYYPASDVQACPLNGKYHQVLGKATSAGVRQAGSGHKAHYRSWAGRCIVEGNGRQIATFNQREWYLPQSKILIVDQWNTPLLADTIKYADWN